MSNDLDTPEFVSDVERWKHDLIAAGWVAESSIAWRAPDGSLWRGPFGAWKELQHQRQQRESAKNREILNMLALRKELDPDAPDAVVVGASDVGANLEDCRQWKLLSDAFGGAEMLLRSWLACMQEPRPKDWAEIADNLITDTRKFLDEKGRLVGTPVGS